MSSSAAAFLKACFAVFGLPALVLLLAGCTRTHYHVELRPEGDQIRRDLTIQRTGTVQQASDQPPNAIQLDDAELQHLAAVYDLPEPPRLNADGAVSFTGRFRGRLPNDVGGVGNYQRWDSPFGSVSIYLERFRGSDDVAAEIKNRYDAVDRLVEHVIGWLETELANDPHWSDLRQFLANDFRRDLKNLSLYLAPLAWADDEPGVGQVAARVGQYLIEHEYGDLSSLPRLTRASIDLGRDDSRLALALVREWLAKRLSRPTDADSFSFLADANAAQQSIEAYLRTTPEYQAKVEQWQQAERSPNQPAPPEPSDLLGEWLVAAFLPHGWAGSSGNRLTIQLHLPAAPVFTNGTWNSEQQRVEWRSPLESFREPYPGWPVVAHAVWSETNMDQQQARFGKTVLSGGSLRQYCLWYAALTDAERRQWDEFIKQLSPGPDLIPRLTAFRFADEPASDDLPSRASPVVDEIVAALK